MGSDEPVSGQGEPVSPNVVRQDFIVSTAQRQALSGGPGAVVWFTGLSGSGKSTIAAQVEHELIRQARLAYLLDGDNLRFGINGDLGFSPEDRIENIRRVGELAVLFAHAGLVALVPVISPYRDARDRVRARCAEQQIAFVEVFVATPLEVCEQRDVKGLYAKARRGEITDMTGVNAPYEEPLHPELVIDHQTSATTAAALVVDYLTS